MEAQIHRTDIVIIGAGAAGLYSALNIQNYNVTVLSKSTLQQGCSTAWAQGGIAAALSKLDSPATHAMDTLTVAADIADEAAVTDVTNQAPVLINKLIRLGLKVDYDAEGRIALGKEAAHTHPRIVHHQDATGAALMEALTRALKKVKTIRVFENTQAITLYQHEGRVAGVYCINEHSQQILYLAKAVVIATGGIGGLYGQSSNPTELLGEGLALAARAGAKCRDLEFVQFHPTALKVKTKPYPLLTEALRGAGANVVDEKSQVLTHPDYANLALAPRDSLARFIWQREQDKQPCFLDARSIPELESRFPLAVSLCKKQGFDIAKVVLPIIPAQHYHMGGISIDQTGQTSVPGLWACGEVACTGIHGANRLASNSLLEALVVSERLAESVSHTINTLEYPQAPTNTPLTIKSLEINPNVIFQVQSILWECVGLIREDKQLQWALTQLDKLDDFADNPVMNNVLLTAKMITRAAHERLESRGSHFRSDYPEMRPEWRHPIFIQHHDNISLFNKETI